MKGIMLKDLYDNFCIAKNLAAYLFAFACVIALALVNHNSYTFVLFISIVFPLLGSCTMEYSIEQDEVSNFNKLMITFPVTKSQIIASKYLLGLCMEGIVSLLSLLFSLAAIFFFHVLTVKQALMAWIWGISFSFLFLAITYVFFFLLGKRWGSICFIFITAVSGAVFGAVSILWGYDFFMDVKSIPVLLCLIPCAIALLGLSYFISLTVFKKRYS